jgi:hypothetical protein
VDPTCSSFFSHHFSHKMPKSNKTEDPTTQLACYQEFSK